MSGARRGDLIAIVTAMTTHYLDRPAERGERVTLAIVSSVTRDGMVKRADELTWADGGTTPWRADARSRVLIIPATLPDGRPLAHDAIVAAYCQRRYPTSPSSRMLPGFDSLAEARAFILEHGATTPITL